MTHAQHIQDTEWYIDGTKGFYEGYYNAFYRTHMKGDKAKCFDADTINNIVMYAEIANNPATAFDNIADIQGDFNKFTAAASIMENVMTCKFEESVIDLMTMCTKSPMSCLPTKIVENLSKNVFILVGKLTSLAEVLQHFPSSEAEDFSEEMKEIGTALGTTLRVLFNFKK